MDIRSNLSLLDQWMPFAFLFHECIYLADFGIRKYSKDTSKLQELFSSCWPSTKGDQDWGHAKYSSRCSTKCETTHWLENRLDLGQPGLHHSNHRSILQYWETKSRGLCYGLDFLFFFLFWLALRSVFYHFSEVIDSSFRREFVNWRLGYPSIKCTLILRDFTRTVVCTKKICNL